MIEIPKILTIYQWIGENIFRWGKWNEPIGWNSAYTTKHLNKRPWRSFFLAYVYKSIALVNELKRLVLILSLLVVIIFHFLRTLLIPLSFFSRLFSTFILDEKYTGCFIKIRNNSWGRPLWVIGIRIGIKLKINISYILAAALGDLGVIKKVCSLETSNLSPLPPPCSSLFILYVYTSSSYPSTYVRFNDELPHPLSRNFPACLWIFEWKIREWKEINSKSQ